jgi:GTP-binding protein
VIPIVAIVGRPNVGKSTLFNRLAGRRLAIVHDTPGVTRDRHYADTFLHGREITLIDTGGFDPASDDPLGHSIARHVRAAIDEADAVVCVLDGSMPSTGQDREAVQLLRRGGKPVVYVANKIDSARQQLGIGELYDLGVDDLIPLSALHGRGTGALETKLASLLPRVAEQQSPQSDQDVPRVALVGRPNGGKSSLLNRLARSERSLVDDRPGTTRDPVDTHVRVGGRTFMVVDTAGIRRRSRVGAGLETACVMRAIRALERAQVAIVVCDATQPIAEQDARLLGLCIERGRATVVALNKTDLLRRGRVSQVAGEARRTLHFASWVPLLPVSAQQGSGVRQLMRAVWRCYGQFRRRVPTAQLNRFVAEVVARNPPPTSGGKAPRIYYVTQTQTAPPVFVAVSNCPHRIRDSYQRFLANQIREAFGFESVPIKVVYRRRAHPDARG